MTLPVCSSQTTGPATSDFRLKAEATEIVRHFVASGFSRKTFENVSIPMAVPHFRIELVEEILESLAVAVNITECDRRHDS